MNTELEIYLDAIKADYLKWSNRGEKNPIQQVIADRMIKDFNAGLEVLDGKVYLKVITRSSSSRSVHSFIVKEDGPKFKRGDILKTASWSAPAKNKARGNIFGTYHINWTGADYLC